MPRTVDGGRPSWSLLALVAAGLLPGCAADSLVETPTTCVADADCQPTGGLCLLGVCGSPNEGSLSEVDLEIRPSPSSGLPHQQVFAVDTTVRDRINVDLRDVSPVGGVVRNAGDGEALGSPEAARLVAVPELSIAGRSLLITANAGSSGGYALPFLASEAYRVRVYPDDEGRAPLFPPDTWLANPAGVDNPPRDILLPDDEDLDMIAGRVTAGAGVESLPISGVEVRVVDGARRISSVSVTDEGGFFVVRVAGGEGPTATLEIQPSELNPAFPTIHLVGIDVTSSQDLGDVNLGEVVSPVPFSGSVTGNDGEPVAGASVFLRGDVGTGEIRRLLTTAADGSFDAEIPAGLYDFVAVAPTGLEAGMVRSGEPLEVGIGFAPLHLVLQSRARATGILFNAEGDPVDSATLSLARLGPPGGADDPVLGTASWSFVTTTSPTGQFSLAIDPGRYRLRIDPAPTSGAPAYTFVKDLYADPDPFNIDLPPAALIGGRVLTPSGMSVGEGTEVRVFARLTGEDGKAISLGSVLTDGDGNFAINLPDLSAAGSDDPDPLSDGGVAGDGG